jgi:hypothetical protein
LTELTQQRFNSSIPNAAKGPNFVIPLALAGVAGGAYYFYSKGVNAPVAAAVQPPNPVLTDPNEWIDFKVVSLDVLLMNS